ncbi:MAG: CapA family protein, partial [Treponemataceae bacterium]|nr:CapA family protein [Treponemataceae bacterium]
MSVKFLAVLAIFPALFFFSCQTTKHERLPKEDKILKLTFAGDIMAHTQNFQMDDFSLIWNDIREKVGAADFAFANLEA